MNRFGDVRAEIIFLSDGLRIPNFMTLTPPKRIVDSVLHLVASRHLLRHMWLSRLSRHPEARRASAALVGLVLAFGPGFSPAASAERLVGTVVGIADGDTVTVLDSTRTQHKVRLAGIDAPEKRQPFGNRSRQTLANLVFRRQVTVEWNKKDRYRRVVGVVRVGDADAGLKLVRAGMAWHYTAYAREQSSRDRVLYGQAQDDARSSRRGLWADAEPQPPWEFRATQRAR